MDKDTISEGPSIEQIKNSLFLDYGDHIGNEGIVHFKTGRDYVGVTIEAAKRLKDGEWEIEGFIPFTDGVHFAAHYSPKTRTGIVLRTWQEN